MQRNWSGALIAVVLAGTAVLGAQGSPRPTNSPPADKAAPAGVQRTPTPPSAKTRTDRVTVVGCVQDAPMTASAGPVAGPAAGTTGATPAEKTAERAGNVPDPHENSSANPQRGPAAPGGERAAADTRTGRNSDADERGPAAATANVPATERSGHVIYYLNNASMTADGDRDRNVAVGTSGLKPSGYRLEGDSASIAAQLNHQVKIEGTIQANPAPSADSGNAAAAPVAAGPTLRVESVTMVGEKCDAK